MCNGDLVLGAISVSLHMISPASKGLFENAIMLSGSALNPSIPRIKDHLTILYNLAENQHYPVDNNRDLLEFLKQIDAKVLTQRTIQDITNSGFGRRLANLNWATVVERENRLHFSMKLNFHQFSLIAHAFRLLDPHAVDKFIGKTPFDILTDDDYESNINSLFSCTLEV